MRPKASNSARKCRYLELDCALPRPLIHLQLSHNAGRSHCQRLARQLWEPLILPGSSRRERKCRCLEPGCQPLPSRRSLAQPPLHPANSRRPLHCQPPHRVPPLLTPLAALGCSQTADIPPETAHIICCHNPWPTEDVLFCPNDVLPAFVTSIPALSSGPELWIAVHNHRPEPLQLHSGKTIGVLEVVTPADSPTTASHTSSRPKAPCHPPLPEHLSLLQQQQINELFREFSDVFS